MPPGSAHSVADSQASGSQVINMRCLIVTMDASVIIGKQGRHIAEIRVSSGSRTGVMENVLIRCGGLIAEPSERQG